VPKVVIHTYFKNKELPSAEEGFTEPIINIPYVHFDQTILS
jgi:hypothetical protein